jgi:hypothetical protein
MPVIRLKDPSPTDGHTRTTIPVKRQGARVGWAVFRDGSYEFEIDEQIEYEIAEGVIDLGFEMKDLRPLAIKLSYKERGKI